MKTLLITGGSGFIGRNLVEQLSSSYTIFSPSHSELDLTNSQVVDAFFQKNHIDVVIHAAYIGGNRKTPFIEDATEKNLQMFMYLARNEKNYQKMIYLGSGAEYDKSKPIVRVKEEEFYTSEPKDQYGMSKYLCSLMAKWFQKVTVLRLFGVYGKYEDKETRFISDAICTALTGRPIQINQNVTFDYLYIDDLAEVVKDFIENDRKDRVYNVGSGKPIDLFSIAKIIKEIAGIDYEIEIKKDGMGNEYTCDMERLSKEVINLRFTPLEKGIQELYEWYKKTT